jgi:hypothetical protein
MQKIALLLTESWIVITNYAAVHYRWFDEVVPSVLTTARHLHPLVHVRFSVVQFRTRYRHSAHTTLTSFGASTFVVLIQTTFYSTYGAILVTYMGDNPDPEQLKSLRNVYTSIYGLML